MGSPWDVLNVSFDVCIYIYDIWYIWYIYSYIYIVIYIYTYTILYFNLVGLNGMVRISLGWGLFEWDGWFFGTAAAQTSASWGPHVCVKRWIRWSQFLGDGHHESLDESIFSSLNHVQNRYSRWIINHKSWNMKPFSGFSHCFIGFFRMLQRFPGM